MRKTFNRVPGKRTKKEWVFTIPEFFIVIILAIIVGIGSGMAIMFLITSLTQ